MKKYYTILLFLTVSVILSCKKPFNPEVTSVNSNLLVVDGTINTGADSTIFRLSRTVLVSDRITAKPELLAIVTVESDANESYQLTDKGAGLYIHRGLNVNPTRKYRLRIKTSKGVTYLSDFVESKVSQPIDSISWNADSRGLQLYTNTHDVTNNTKYYRWDYEETWMFRAKYHSDWIYTPQGIVFRDDKTQNIYECWAGQKSSNIVLGSTARLEKDIVNNNPLTTIPSTSEKVSVKYSILVRQYALTKEAFDFWSELRKNTENLGSIFDAQPSELTGNVHNTATSSEPVIGYVGAGTTTSKRIFIQASQLPNWRVVYPLSCSSPDTLSLADAAIAFRQPGNIIVEGISSPLGNINAYTRSSRDCADCTARGVNKQPDFWK